MSLAPGTRIGHYEILDAIGAGGMGEVYRARDARLGRDVALKILPETFASDAERLARFQREATTLAALNHPHIAQIYGIEENLGSRALIMELVEGRDLSQRLNGRAVALHDALSIARQIAEALAAAHQAGIVHRDLKPANIRVRPDGVVKVLDFGLAKLAVDAVAEPPLDADAATMASADVTRAGIILGTAAYMPPEQAQGRPVDRRADIWAFGCILFEMLTGRQAFSGATVTDVLASVLTRDPEWRTLPAQTPESIRRLLRRCLQKDAVRRLRDIGDACLELDDARDAPVSIERPARRAWPIALIALISAALASTLFKLATIPAAAPATPADLVRSQRLTDMTGLEETPALSPDGRSVAFTAGVNGKRQIFVQLLEGGGAPLLITGDDVDHQFPRWTPTSSSVVYFVPATPGDRQGTLYEVPALGGVPRRVVDSMGAGDLFGRDGRLAYFRLAGGKIQLVTGTLDGSSANVLQSFEPTSYYLNPRWSPDGTWIAYQRGNGNRWDLFIASADSTGTRQLTSDGRLITGFCWLPDGTGLLFSSTRGDTSLYLPTSRLWQVSLADGAARQLTSGEVSYVNPDIASDGSVVASKLRLESDIWMIPDAGTPRDNLAKAVRLTRQTGHVLTPTPSPDGREVAFISDRGGRANLWAVNVEGGALRQITRESDPDVVMGVPTWSPSNDAIAFVSSRGGTPGSEFGIWLVNPDGSNLRQLVLTGVGPTWSPDGRFVYYATTSDQQVFKVTEGGTPITLQTSEARNVIGSDGKTMYMTVERRIVDGLPEYEIRAATPEDAPSRLLAQVSPSRVRFGEVFNPTLSRDGREIAMALTDGFHTNIWTLSTSSAEWRQITDFRDKPTFIGRKVAWSSDSRSVLAAIAEGDADIVLLRGLLKPNAVPRKR